MITLNQLSKIAKFSRFYPQCISHSIFCKCNKIAYNSTGIQHDAFTWSYIDFGFYYNISSLASNILVMLWVGPITCAYSATCASGVVASYACHSVCLSICLVSSLAKHILIPQHFFSTKPWMKNVETFETYLNFLQFATPYK